MHNNKKIGSNIQDSETKNNYNDSFNDTEIERENRLSLIITLHSKGFTKSR